MSEKYRSVPGVEYISVSNNGIVYSSLSKMVRKNVTGTDGYHYIRHRNKNYAVHRLVALAWIGVPEIPKQVNHKNGIKTDNRIENLEWLSHAENLQHALDTGLRTTDAITYKRNEESPNSKPVLQLSLSGEFIKEWPCAWEVNRVLGISQQNISKMCTGAVEVIKGVKYKRKSAGGFIWKFK